MAKLRTGQWLALIVAAGLFCGAANAGSISDLDAEPQIVPAYTQPSERAQLSFKNPGILAKTLVKEGDSVKSGELLMEQDDRLEQKQYESLKLQGDSDVKPNAKKAELAVREHEYQRVKDLYENKHVASTVEVETAELDRDDAKAEWLAAKEDQQVKKLDAQAMAIRLDQMRLHATFNGRVEQIVTQPGELTDPAKPSIVVVNNDPLWVMVNLPNRLVDRLQMGSVLEVRYADSQDPTFAQNQKWLQAKVNFMSPRGDGQQRLVRLTLPNPTDMSSGRQVQVKLPLSLLSGGPTASAKE